MTDARIQNRINFLKKNRPNDPEIKQLQKKLGSMPADPSAPEAAPAPAPEVPAEPLPKVAVDYASEIAADSGVKDAFTPTLTDRPLQPDLNQARLQQQQELESYLSRDIDSAYEKARKQQEQQLFNRGVPVGSEQYTDSMKMLDDNFSRQRGDIRSQALQFGGQETERTFGMGETRRTNELGEQVTANQTNMGNVGAFTDIDLAYKQLQEQKRQANQNASLTRAQIAKQGGGGRASTSTPIVESPFVG
jgi:hypothetical protein